MGEWHNLVPRTNSAFTLKIILVPSNPRALFVSLKYGPHNLRMNPGTSVVECCLGRHGEGWRKKRKRKKNNNNKKKTARVGRVGQSLEVFSWRYSVISLVPSPFLLIKYDSIFFFLIVLPFYYLNFSWRKTCRDEKGIYFAYKRLHFQQKLHLVWSFLDDLFSRSLLN